jgi:hypothetical protein
MLKPIKGKLGHFTSTILVPEWYEEVEPENSKRKFVAEIRIGEFREEDKFDTVRLLPSKRVIGVWEARRIWFFMRTGEVLCDIADTIQGWGLRLQGYNLEAFSEDEE